MYPLELTCGDENGDLEGDFVAWRGLLWPLLRNEFGMNNVLMQSTLHETYMARAKFRIVNCQPAAADPERDGPLQGMIVLQGILSP